MTEQQVSERTRLVMQALEAGGAAGQVRVLPSSARTAVLAAEALGCEVGAIANSLVFWCDDEPLLIMTSGDHRVDLDVVAAAIGAGPIRRAKPDEVRRATGQAIGGVAPVGHPAPLRTLVDRKLDRFERIWAAGGAPETVFPTSYRELLALTNGTAVDVE